MSETMRGKTLLKGHALRDEGMPFGDVPKSLGVWAARRLPGYDGRALCTCGARSPELRSNAARKQWHREHKAEVSS